MRPSVKKNCSLRCSSSVAFLVFDSIVSNRPLCSAQTSSRQTGVVDVGSCVVVVELGPRLSLDALLLSPNRVLFDFLGSLFSSLS